jgi:hypothetical protein
MSGNNPTFTSPISLSSGTLLVDGSEPGSAVTGTGGTLGGSGTVGPVTSTGTINPGTPPATGILSVHENVTINAPTTFKVALQGADPGTGFDQLAVTGTADITGSNLSASLSGFAPASGETFPIITSTAAIVGTFNNLNEGASLAIGGIPFTISYLNDAVTLMTATTTGPTATTDPATSITGTTATLNGSANPNGSATTVEFIYGTDANLTSNTSMTPAQSIGSGTSAMAVTAALTGLVPGTQYFDKVVAMSTAGTTSGSIVSFTTPEPPTAATTAAATNVTTTSATLNGSVNPAGSATTVSFVYGTDSTLTTGATTTAPQSIGSGTSAVDVTAALTGLQPGTTYYDKVIAASAGGTASGTIQSFTTSSPLSGATTAPATNLTGTSATLNGSVNPAGSATTVSFVYGTDSTLTSNTSTTPPQSIGSRASTVAATAALTGLQPGTTYYDEVIATSAGGTASGMIQSFTTPIPPTGTITGAATNITTTSATLNGSANPAGSATTVLFVYGTDPTLTTGATTTAAQAIGSGTNVVVVNETLTNLQPGVTYYFRFVATSAGGTARGSIVSFTTSISSSTSPTPTSPVTVTSFGVEKVKVGTGRHAKRALALGVGFSGALSSTAAQNLGAYTVFSGKVKKVHKMSQVLYNGLVPLTQAIYFPASNTVALLPRGKHKLPKLEQLHVNVSILTDPMGRSINNGKNFTATVSNTGLVISADRISGSKTPTAAAVDALFEDR